MQKTNRLLKDLQDLIETLKNKPVEIKTSPLKDLWLSKYQRVISEMSNLGIDERNDLEKAYSQWWSEFQKTEKTEKTA